MDQRYERLDLMYNFNGAEQHLFPVVLLGGEDVVLVDCGYPGSLEMLEEQLRQHGIRPDAVTKLVLTHQDDDHIGTAAAWKKKYPAVAIVGSRTETPYLSGYRKNLRLQQAEQLQDSLPEDQKDYGEQFCSRYRTLAPVPVDLQVSGGDRFGWGGGCEVVATPGHTPGHISIRALDNAFMVTGDGAVAEDGELAIANPAFCLDRAAAQRSLDLVAQYHCREYLCYHGGLVVR